MSFVITINREYGSGGRIVGEKVAQILGVKFYDKALIALTAQKSGFTEEYIKETSEKKTFSLLYNLYMTSLPVSDQIFLAQSQAIKEVSDSESAVIVGGCADYVLRDEPHCFKVFLYAPMEEKIARVRDEYKEDVSGNTRVYIQRLEKKRVSYYNYFTQNKWGHAPDYHLCLNTSVGIDSAAEIIIKSSENFRK